MVEELRTPGRQQGRQRPRLHGQPRRSRARPRSSWATTSPTRTASPPPQALGGFGVLVGRRRADPRPLSPGRRRGGAGLAGGRADEPPDRRLQPGQPAHRRGRGDASAAWPWRWPRRCGNIPASGSAGAARPRRSSPAQLDMQTVDGVTAATVDLEEADLDEYYNGYANKTLWPLFHYRIDLAAYDRVVRRGLRAGEPAVRRDAGAADRARRPDLGARLPPDPAGPGAARAGGQEPDRLLPAHPLAGAPGVHHPAAATGSWWRRCSTTTWSASRPRSTCRPSRTMCSSEAGGAPAGDGPR